METVIKGFEEFREEEYFCYRTFSLLLKKVYTNRRREYKKYINITTEIIRSSIRSFSTFRGDVSKYLQNIGVPKASIFSYIRPMYHRHVKSFFKKYSRTFDRRTFDGSCKEVFKCILGVDAVSFDANRASLSRAKAMILAKIVNAYAIAATVSLILHQTRSSINNLFIKNPGMSLDKKIEWDNLQESLRVDTHQDAVLITPWTIVLLVKQYTKYKLSIRNQHPIVDVTQHSPSASTRHDTTIQEMVEHTPKRLGLDVNNLQETRLRQRRRSVSSKFL